MKNNKPLASRVVQDKFNFVPSTKSLPYCSRCGYVGTKLCNVKRHTKANLNFCCKSDIRPADGTIITNEYGFLILHVVLDKISNGLFTLPTKRSPTNNVARNTNNIPNIQPVPSHRAATPSYSQSHGETTIQCLLSDQDIMMALFNNSSYKGAVSLSSFALSELSNTF
jgi:hypothetical protein